jgi:hypothetical protein
MQPPLPLHAPLHPENVDPGFAAAVKDTELPVAKFALQALPQLMPLGLLVTVPDPVPARATVSVALDCDPVGGVGGFGEVVDMPPLQPESAKAIPKITANPRKRELSVRFIEIGR